MTPEFLEIFIPALDETLTEREFRIVTLRFGISGDKPQTLAKIAENEGVSRERVRQILERVERKIRANGNSKLEQGLLQGACAALVFHLLEELRPSVDGAEARIEALRFK